MIGRKGPWWRTPSELCQLIHVSLMLHCCHMLPWRRDLGHPCCWERCPRLASSGRCLRCVSSREGRRTERPEMGPELSASSRLNAGRRAAAAAASCQPSRPEAGGGSSCERCETLSCRTSWREEEERDVKLETCPCVRLEPVNPLTCHTACRGRNRPMSAQEAPLPAQEAWLLACLSVQNKTIYKL